MQVDDLTRRQVDLVLHAQAMGGWLTADYCATYSDDTYELTDRCWPQVFVLREGGGPKRYQLTAAGQELADRLRDREEVTR